MRAGEVEEMSEQQVGKQQVEQVEKQANNAVTDLSLNWKEEEPRFFTEEEQEELDI